MKIYSVPTSGVPAVVELCPTKALLRVKVTDWPLDLSMDDGPIVVGIKVAATVLFQSSPKDTDLSCLEANAITDTMGLVTFVFEAESLDTVDRVRIECVGILQDLPVELLKLDDMLTETFQIQRLGFELECAGITLQIPGDVQGNCYGAFLFGTEEKAFAAGGRAIPVLQMTLEERKAKEPPRVELQSSPQPLQFLKETKAWMMDVIGHPESGETVGEWAEYVATLDHFTWRVAKSISLINGNQQSDLSLDPIKLSCKHSEGIVQGNLDLYLDQFFTAPETFIASLSTTRHFQWFLAAKQCAKTWCVPLVTKDPRWHIHGLVTYAFFYIVCAVKVNKNLDELELTKDTVKPMLKCNIASELLLTDGLTDSEQEALANRVCPNGISVDKDSLTNLAKACKLSGKVDGPTLDFIAKVMKEWFVNLDDTTLACRAGKRIEARPNIAGRTMVVVEIRGNSCLFNNTYFHGL